ncbi:MAG TPA: ATP-binding protein [Chloroflexota bacterium]
MEAASSPSARASADILVAHANSALRLQITHVLTGDGFVVREAANVQDALASMDLALPDLLILAGQPVSDDPALLGALRAHPVRAAMAMLALDSGGEQASLLDAGADDVLPLPFSPQSLRVKVQALLRLKLAERTARELVSRHTRDQQSLQRASQRLVASRSLSEVLTVAAEVVRANLGYDRVSIALHDEESQTLHHVIGTDDQGRVFRPQETPISVSLRPGSALRDLPAYQALFEQGQETYYIPDTAGRAPAYFRPYLDGPVRESLLVGLRAGERVAGLITVDNLLSGRPFGPESEGLLVTLARQIALAIERARLAEELERRAREAEALAQVGVALTSALQPAEVYDLILRQAAVSLAPDLAAIVLYHDHDVVLEGMWGEPDLPPGTIIRPLEHGRCAWLPTEPGPATQIRDTLLYPGWFDYPPWVDRYRVRSLIAVPLLADGTVLGSFVVASFTPERFTGPQVGLATAFAERASLALRNARLRIAEQDRIRATEEFARLQNDFVESVSHELRTPLTSIIGYAEMLQAHWGSAEDGQRLDWVRKIVVSAGRQKRLVEDLLLISRIEAGALAPRIERVSLMDIARSAGDEVQGSYTGQRVDVAGPEHLAVLADPGRALQVVTNLIDNAAKYSPEGSPIIVWWCVEDDWGVLRVVDRGPGIPADARGQLFTRFGRVPGSRIRAGRVGTGLGLFLGRSLVQAMGGELDVESSSSEGSTFRLRLPLARD